jgi:hypothetical protein
MCGAAGTRYPVSYGDPGAMIEWHGLIAHKNSKYEGEPQIINSANSVTN